MLMALVITNLLNIKEYFGIQLLSRFSDLRVNGVSLNSILLLLGA